jgi:putative tryptophan/tyrosine transport system substrate-binding protein
VIFTFASDVFAAKVATTAIPIVFVIADDPVRLGLVTNLPRPTGNLTGINFLNAELGAKRLELLRELMPMASRIVLLGTPTGAASDAALIATETAALAAGLRIQVVKVSTKQEIDAAFAGEWPDALFVSPIRFSEVGGYK